MDSRGVRTSEFWLTILTLVVVIVGRVLGLDLDVLVVTGAAYPVGRGLAKMRIFPVPIPPPPPPPPPPGAE